MVTPLSCGELGWERAGSQAKVIPGSRSSPGRVGAGQLQTVLVVLVPVSTEVLDLISPLALEMARCPSLGNMNLWARMGWSGSSREAKNRGH